MCAVLGDSALLLQTVNKWRTEFTRGRRSNEDDPCSGAPAYATTPECIAAMEKLVMADRSITQEKIAEILGVLKGTVNSIMHEQSHMTKVCTKWVPRILTVEVRHTR